jgi:hypothetical protein
VYLRLFTVRLKQDLKAQAWGLPLCGKSLAHTGPGGA